MKHLRSIRTILSAFLIVVYVFVAGFSQMFHHHSYGYPSLKDIKISHKTELSSKITKEATDCLACFILHHSDVTLPDNFGFKAFAQSVFKVQLTAYQQKFSQLLFHHVFLRGPPQNV